MARWQVPVVLGTVALGVVAGLTTDVGAWSENLVVPALVGLLVLTFAGIHPGALRAHVRPNRHVVAASLGMNFVWAPLLAGLLGWLLLSDNLDLRIGLVMLFVTPCTDWYLVFTGAARGNVALAAAILPVNLVTQIALLPVFLAVLTGARTDIAVGRVAAGVALVAGVPFAVALGARVLASSVHATRTLDRMLERLEPIGLALLGIAIAAIFSAHAQLVVDEPAALLRLAGPLVFFFAATYLLAGFVSTVLRIAPAERATLTMTTMARNSPLALAVATVAFPDQPLIAVALVVGPLIELPVLSATARALTPSAR